MLKDTVLQRDEKLCTHTQSGYYVNTQMYKLFT